jgi:hypothetical protein
VNFAKHFRVYALVLLATSFHSWSAQAKDRPDAKNRSSFRVDLKQFGYLTDEGEFSSLGFLSNNLLLVVVNQGVLFSVQPLSTFIVFDVAKKQPLHSAQMMVTKSPGAVAVLTSGDFLVASSSDVKLCSADLRCDKSFPSHAGYPLDSDKVKKITGMDIALRPDDVSIDNSRAISAELSSTIWNKITHPLGGIDEPTPPNFRRISVYDNRSRETIFSMHYDPKNHLIGPALSPNGSRLAVVREGTLELFDLP